MWHLRLIAVWISLIGAAAQVAPPKLPDAIQYLYKQTSKRPLYLYVLSPKGLAGPRPAVVFFFGGGWKSGSTDQFDDQARHLTERGMVSILVDYRVSARDQSTPFDSVKDARSAMRWVRSHAVDLHVDASRIIAAGGSAGGHLAGATAILNDVDDPGDDLRISAAPQALVLFNPVVDTTEHGYGASMIGKDAIALSLTHHIRPGLPPMILFHGTGDHTVPFANAEKFARRVKATGGDCTLVAFKGADHGFFNSPRFTARGSEQIYQAIMRDVDAFLMRLGYEAPSQSHEPKGA